MEVAVMAKIKRTALPWTTVWAHGTGVVRLPASPWMSANEIIRVRGTFELRGRDGDIEVAIGIELADVENSPTAPTDPTITAYANDNGMKYPAAWKDVSADSQSKQLARWVWLVKNTSSQNLTFARVGGVVDVEEC
jgi:hypothetical protein